MAPSGIPPPVERAWLHWYGPVAPETAHRVCCDSRVWRIHLDPATGLISVTRPDGSAHDVGPSKPWTTPTTRNDEPPDG